MKKKKPTRSYPVGFDYVLSCFCNKKISKFCRGQRLREIEALDLVAACVLKKEILLRILNTLGDDREVKELSDLKNASEQVLTFIILGDIFYKSYIKLKSIERKIGEHVDGRVAFSEVIHFNHEAFSLELFYHRNDLFNVVCVSCLSDLKMKIVGFDPVICYKLLEIINDVGIEDIYS